MTSNVIQPKLLETLSFPVPGQSECLYIASYPDHNIHLKEGTSEIISRTIQQAATQHCTSFTVSTRLTEREINLLEVRNGLFDGLKIKIDADPTDLNKKVITISIDYNRELSKKIFVAPKPPAEQKVEVSLLISKKQERMNQYKDMDIMANGALVSSINYTQLLLLTEDSAIENVVNAGGVIHNPNGRMEISISKFDEHPSKVKLFMDMVLNQSVPSHLSIEDISIYLDWAEMMGASNTKAALFNLLVKHPGLEEYCDNPVNRQNLRVFSQTGNAPAEVKKFIQEYVLFYGNTHFDQLSAAERKELEIVNHPHYEGDIDPNQATAILKNRSASTGEVPYLLRSSASIYGSYTISFVQSPTLIGHIRFSIDEEGKLVLSGSAGSNRKFETLNDLIQFIQGKSK